MGKKAPLRHSIKHLTYSPHTLLIYTKKRDIQEKKIMNKRKKGPTVPEYAWDPLFLPFLLLHFLFPLSPFLLFPLPKSQSALPETDRHSLNMLERLETKETIHLLVVQWSDLHIGCIILHKY